MSAPIRAVWRRRAEGSQGHGLPLPPPTRSEPYRKDITGYVMKETERERERISELPNLI